MNEVVEYHNDLHKLQINRFSELEQNLLFGILTRCRNKYDDFILTLDDLNALSASRKYTANEMLQKVLKLRESIFKLDFTLIQSKNDNRHEYEIYNLFSRFVICYEGKQNDVENAKLIEIRLKVNEDFRYLIAYLTRDFIQYELEEFIFLNSRYTKTIYRYLKQFRTTGIWGISLENFRELLDIPASYKICDIDKQILKPAIKQLSEPLNLFETARIPFKHLEVKKKKECGRGHRGRGGVITHLIFTFEPQPASVQEAQQAELNAQKAKQIQAQEPHYIKRLRELCAKHAIFYKNSTFYYLFNELSVTKQDNNYKITVYQHLVQRLNQYGANGYFDNHIVINNYEQAQNLIKSCEYYEKNKKNLEKKLLEQISK